MPRLPLFAFVLPLLTGCATSYKSSSAPSAPPMAEAVPVPASSPRPADEGSLRGDVSLSADSLATVSIQGTTVSGRSIGVAQRALSSLPGVAQGAAGGGAPPPATPVPVATSPQGGSAAPSPAAQTARKGVHEMLAVEAHLTVEVPRVGEAVIKTRDLIVKHGGQLINDVYTDARAQSSSALSIRVPVAATEAFLTDLGALGRMRSRRVTATDVGRQFHDSSILLRNLEITMARYEELLKTAKETKDLLAIENELTRLRTQIDRVKSELSGLGDRVERSTIYLSLQPPRDESRDVSEPEAHFYPDFHGTYLYDLGDKSSFLGGGVGVRISRAFGVDISALRHLDGPFDRDLLIATMGGEVYSDFLGGGRRTAGNVFLGARAGVLYGRGRTEAIIPLTLGVELFHTKTVTVEVRGRGDIFFGSSRGAHLGLQPDLGVAFAF